jgi:lysophospholipase L1-like esterase
MSTVVPSIPSIPPHRRILRWLVLLLAWTLVPLFAAEVVFRARHKLREKPEDYGLTMKSENRQRRYQYRPGFSGISHGNHHVRINSFGFRGREYREKKGATTRRILLLGDSVTFGLSCEGKDIYPTLLEKYLNRQEGPWTYEVLNGAVNGYNAENQLGTLRQMGPLVDPDLVILQTCINDIAPSNYVSAIGGGSYFNYRGDYLPEAGLLRSAGEFLEAHSVLAAEIAVNLDRYLKEKGKREDYFYYYQWFYREIFLGEFEHPKVARAWEQVLETTAEMHREATRQGSRFLCLIFLPSHLMKYPERPGGYTSRLTALAEENGYPYIIMKDEFIDRWDDRHIYIDRVHLNGWGHELTAKIIRDYLVANPGLFECS